MRLRQWVLSPDRHRSHRPQTTLISPTTRWPTRSLSGDVDDLADELVPEHAAEAHVALGDLQVGRADAGLADADERVAEPLRGLRVARVQREGLSKTSARIGGGYTRGGRWLHDRSERPSVIIKVMTMPVAQRRYTIQEYLAFEEGATDKHEFHDGEIRMMSGGTYSQAVINANLIRALGNRLESGPCRAVDSNLRVRIGTRADYVYPDVSVICGQPSFDPDDRKQTTVLNPRLVIETLSDSTESYDRGEKFLLYREIDSLEEYRLVSQHIPRVETFTRQPDGTWRIERAVSGLETSVRLMSLNLEVPLREIYRGVVFTAAEGR